MFKEIEKSEIRNLYGLKMPNTSARCIELKSSFHLFANNILK